MRPPKVFRSIEPSTTYFPLICFLQERNSVLHYINAHKIHNLTPYITEGWSLHSKKLEMRDSRNSLWWLINFMFIKVLSVCLSACLSVGPSACLSVCLSVCLSSYLSVCMSGCIWKKYIVGRLFYNCLDFPVKLFYQAAHLHVCHPETLQFLANCLLNITPK